MRIGRLAATMQQLCSPAALPPCRPQLIISKLPTLKALPVLETASVLMRITCIGFAANAALYKCAMLVQYVSTIDIHLRRFSSSFPPSSMSNKKCNRIKLGHSICGHEVFKYTFCGGTHDNTHEKREECYNTPGLPAPTTEKPPNLEAKCPNCLAKAATWDCCRCRKVVQAGSERCHNCSHAFCLDCATGVN
jgi:hypothetical protein